MKVQLTMLNWKNLAKKQIEVKTRIKRLRNFINSKNENNSTKTEITKNTISPKSQVKLPKLEIARFSGEYIKWQTYKDSFYAGVYSCKLLRNVKKFNYLRGYLEEDTLYCISGLTLTNDNYLEAFGLLTERYGNTQNIITAHVNELLETKRSKKRRNNSLNSKAWISQT